MNAPFLSVDGSDLSSFLDSSDDFDLVSLSDRDGSDIILLLEIL